MGEAGVEGLVQANCCGADDRDLYAAATIPALCVCVCV